VLAHQPPLVANSIPWSGAVLLLGTDVLVIDELHDFVSHPAAQLTSIFPLQAQWEGWTQQLTNLKKRVAFIRDPAGSVTRVQSLDMPDPDVDPGRLAAVGEHYLNECFYPAGFHQPDESIPLFAAEPPFVPVVELAA
jgi:hypothetical protein